MPPEGYYERRRAEQDRIINEYLEFMKKKDKGGDKGMDYGASAADGHSTNPGDYDGADEDGHYDEHGGAPHGTIQNVTGSGDPIAQAGLHTEGTFPHVHENGADRGNLYDPEQIHAAIETEVENRMARFFRSLDMAAEATEKNMVDNFLVAGMKTALNGSGIGGPEVESAVDRGMALGGQKYFQTVIATARQWMDLDASAFAQVEQVIRNSNVLHRAAAVEEPSPGFYGAYEGWAQDGPAEPTYHEMVAEAHGMRRRAMAGSHVPSTDGMGFDVQASSGGYMDQLAAAMPIPQTLDIQRRTGGLPSNRR